MEKALHEGDYVLVNKRPVKSHLKRNQTLLFTSPLLKDAAHTPLIVSRCVALPGDTIEVGSSGYRVNSRRLPRSPHALLPYAVSKRIIKPFTDAVKQLGIPLGKEEWKEEKNSYSVMLTPFEEYQIREELKEEANRFFTQKETGNYTLIVPYKGQVLRLIPPVHAAYKEAVLIDSEGSARFHNGILHVKGKESNTYTFRQDYYWALSDNTADAVDSRHLGFIPAGHIIGKVWFCWYSRDKQLFFKKVH
jgi:signal peptidase I